MLYLAFGTHWFFKHHAISQSDVGNFWLWRILQSQRPLQAMATTSLESPVHLSSSNILGFLKWGYPKLDGLYCKIPLKWMIWEYPYFRRPSRGNTSLCKEWQCADLQTHSGFSFRVLLTNPIPLWSRDGANPSRNRNWNTSHIFQICPWLSLEVWSVYLLWLIRIQIDFGATILVFIPVGRLR